MRRRLIVAAALSALAAALVTLAGFGQGGPTAAQANGANPVVVSAPGCIYFGTGEVTVDPGTIVIRSGWASGPQGAVQSFLNAQVTIVSVNDGDMVDASAFYGAPEPWPAVNQQGWVSWFNYPTGVTLASGQSMRFTFTLYMTRGVADIYDADNDGSMEPTTPTGAGLSFGGTCTVTAR